MINRRTGFTFTAGLYALCLVLSACSNEQNAGDNAPEGGKLSVVCTIGMIADVAHRIAGDNANVVSLMGAGVDPHLYKPTEGDVNRISKADIVFYNGLHLEAKMADVLERMGKTRRVVAVTDAIDKASLDSPPEFKGAVDPHVWFDVTLWMKAAERIRDTLAEADAANGPVYQENAKQLLAEMEKLHDYVKQQAESVQQPQRVLITAHDAFNYFGRAYGFEVRGLQGISTASEAGAADVEKLAQFIADRKILAIFVESSVPRRNVEAVQEAVKAKVFDVKIGGELFSDAMGDPGTPEGTYIGMVRHNIDTIVRALKE